METIFGCKYLGKVVAAVPASENLPDGQSTKPGDINQSMQGLMVEMINTDADGRLILADALTYVKSFKPDVVIDMATLTGARVIAVGHQTAAAMGNREDLVHGLLAASKESQGRAWDLPLLEKYHEQLKSPSADLSNTGGRPAGTITAACFLSRFAEDYRWTHLDIAGVAWKSGKLKGATGRPVGLLVQYLVQRAKINGVYSHIFRMLLVVISLLVLTSQPGYATAVNITTVTGTGDSPPMNINSLLPIVNNDSLANFQAVELLFIPVIWVNINLEIDWSRSIAKSITFTHHRTVVVIHLKRWQWSNNDPVTADDVIFCIDIMRQYGEKYSNYGMGGIPYIIKRANAPNPQTLILTLSHPVNPIWFELNGISQLIPLPKLQWKNITAEFLFNHQTDTKLLTVVDGPYKLAKYQVGREAMFLRNNHYSGNKPDVHRITFVMYTSASGAFWALKSKQINLANVPHMLLPGKQLVNSLHSCVTNGGYGINYVALNFTNNHVGFLRTLSIRQALQHAINQEAIIKIAYHGMGEASFNPVPSDPATYLSPQMRKITENPASQYNPRQSKAILTAAGWKTSPSGVRTRHGRTLSFTLLVSSSSRTLRAIAELLKAEWWQIGVQVNLHIVPFNNELSILGSGKDWEAAMVPWIYSPDFFPSGDGLFNSYGGMNYGKYSNTRMNFLIHDSETKNGLPYLYKYENYAADQLPVLFLPMPHYLVKYSHGISRNQANVALSLVHCSQ